MTDVICSSLNFELRSQKLNGLYRAFATSRKRLGLGLGRKGIVYNSAMCVSWQNRRRGQSLVAHGKSEIKQLKGCSIIKCF